MATFQIDVVSAEHKLFSGEATGLFITTTEGSMGILPGHQPLLAALDIAGAHIDLGDGSRQHVAVHRGYVYYSGGDTAVILADIAELAQEIDVEEERKHLMKLERMRADEVDHLDLELPAMVRMAETRIAVAEKANGKS